MDWYYSSANTQQGPVSEPDLLDLVSKGIIKSDTLVWNDNLPNWIAFSETNLSSGMAKCAYSGGLQAESSMLQYGNSWVLPEHKEAFVQRMQEGGMQNSELENWGQYVYKDPRRLAMLVKGGILLCAIPIFLVLLWATISHSEINSKHLSEDSSSREMFFFIGIGIWGVITLTAFIFYLIWVHRVCNNAHVILKRQMDQTPGWAVGFYFIPIASLFKPYIAMREVWNTSQRKPTDTGSQIIGWWWATHLGYTILNGLPFVATACIIPALILVWIIITRITRWQSELAGIE